MNLPHLNTTHADRFSHIKEATWVGTAYTPPSVVNGMMDRPQVHMTRAGSNFGLTGFVDLAEAQEYLKIFNLEDQLNVRDLRDDIVKLAEEERRSGLKTIVVDVRDWQGAEAADGSPDALPIKLEIGPDGIRVTSAGPDGQQYEVYIEVENGLPRARIYTHASDGPVNIDFDAAGGVKTDATAFEAQRHDEPEAPGARM
jgi:hypothetical protein